MVGRQAQLPHLQLGHLRSSGLDLGRFMPGVMHVESAARFTLALLQYQCDRVSRQSGRDSYDRLAREWESALQAT